MASCISEDAWPEPGITSNQTQDLGYGTLCFFQLCSPWRLRTGLTLKTLWGQKKRWQAGQFNMLDRETARSQFLLINEFMRYHHLRNQNLEKEAGGMDAGAGRKKAGISFVCGRIFRLHQSWDTWVPFAHSYSSTLVHTHTFSIKIAFIKSKSVVKLCFLFQTADLSCNTLNI